MSIYILDTFIFILSVLLISCSGVPMASLNVPLKQVPDLVDLLKQDLRRNNDDYIEMTTTTISRSSNTQKTTKLSITPAPVNHTYATNQDFKQANVFNNQGPVKGVHNRRNIEDEEDDNEESNAEKESAPVNRAEDLPDHSEDPVDTISSTVKSDIEAQPNEAKEEAEYLDLKGSKQEKFKNFVETNQKLFNDFISKKQAEAQMKLMQSRTNNGAMNNDGAAAATAAAVKQEPVMRARYDSVVNPPYNERQLDMAPAKGGRIHAMRIKGRLCQRNVLLPEGPKYDSQGTAYLGAYQSNGGRDYSHTRQPKFVLPRCCNCCKKSVLGCE